MLKRIRLVATALLPALVAGGCASMTNTEKGVGVGGALGAGTGALIGSATGHTALSSGPSQRKRTIP